MAKEGYPTHLVKTVKSLYETRISVRTGNKTSNTIIVNQGVKQGCPLSPTLFNIYIDKATEEWQNKITTGINIGTTLLKSMLFADDQILMAESEDDLQVAAYQLQLIMEKYNLKISNHKTKTMAFEGVDHRRCKIVLNNEIIEQVSSFNYLGCNISYLKEQDVKNKMSKFQQMCGTIRRTLKNKTQRSTQLKFYTSLAVPILTYGSENWSINRATKKKIETSEMKFLRSVAGLTLLDHQRNEHIRQQLNIFNLTEIIQRQKHNWFQHIRRMNDDRLPKVILNYEPRGHRNVGRPRTRWLDDINFEDGTGQ